MYRGVRSGLALSALLGLALGAGCSLYVGDIDRTQPDRVDKSFFNDGKPWYFRQTVIDLPPTSNLSFIGEQGETSKIIWQIDEHYLYAYRAHEWLVDGETGSTRLGVAYRGTPIAAFAIESHFDVKREYNPQTGEQTNVIVENSSDRPWNERDYMRVDWSRNLISDFRFIGGYVAQQPVSRYVREGEDSRDAAVISKDYMDIVHEIVAEPEIDPRISAYYGFPIPTCWLYSSIYADCMGARMKMRSSFYKVPTDHEYTPMEYDDRKFDKFGYFRVERYGFDPAYGIVDPRTQLLIGRFNLWHRAPGEADCRDDSLEHPWERCGNDRIRPIVYYVNEDFPEALKPAQKKVMEGWNDAFKDAVSHMTGRAKSELPDIVVACVNNPVREGDPSQCGQPGLRPQPGDIRYSMVNYVRSPQESAPLGYGPNSPDPETGEVISAAANIYGTELETYVQYTLDFVKLLNGDLIANDFYDGSMFMQHYQRLREQRKTSAMRYNPAALRQLATDLRVSEKAAVLRARISRGELTSDEVPARMEKLRRTELDGVFFPEPMRQALAPRIESAADVPAEMRSFLSSATMHDPSFMRRYKEREHRLSVANLDMAEFFDDAMVSLAKQMDCKNLDASKPEQQQLLARFCTEDRKIKEAEAFTYLLNEIYIGVTLHEVGHNFGLRHNFAASNDAINFFPKYWELRGLTLKPGEQTLVPEYMLEDEETQQGLEDALAAGLRGYQYSSIMDYLSRPNSDLAGLGLYDYAAIRYGYGGMVEVFDRTATDGPRVMRTPNSNTNAYLGPLSRHYTQYPDIISAAPALPYADRVASIYKRKVVKEEQLATDTTLVEVPYRFCSDEYVNGLHYCYRFDQGADAAEQVQSNSEMYENYYVFYGLRRGRVGFGTNLMGYLGRIYGRYFEFLSAQFKHFVNDELIVNFNDYECEEGVHYADPKCGQNRWVAALDATNALGRAIQTPEPGCYVRLTPGCYQESEEKANGLPVKIERLADSACNGDPPNLVKVTDATPYKRIENSSSCDAYLDAMNQSGSGLWEPAADMPLGVGRYSLDKFDRVKFGYYFYWKPTAIGAWWDKWLAMQALGDPYTDFIGVDARGNARSYLISFRSIFGNLVDSFVGGYITEDYGRYAPYVAQDMDGNPRMYHQDLIATNRMLRPPGSIQIAPEGDGQYMTRLQAMYIGAMYYTQLTDDTDFVESMLIGKAGSTVDVQVAADVRSNPDRYVELTDPVTGYVYYAVKKEPPTALNDERAYYSIGYEYLRRVKDEFLDANGNLKAGKSLDLLRQEFRMMEIMRGLLSVYGYTNAGGMTW